MISSRTKPVDVHYHFIREFIKDVFIKQDSVCENLVITRQIYRVGAYKVHFTPNFSLYRAGVLNSVDI